MAALAGLALAPTAMAQTLGTASAVISGKDARVQENAAGNLIADAVRSTVKTDIAIIPAGAITDAEVGPGPITRDSLATLLTDPGDHISVLSLTGEQVRLAMERSLNVLPRPWPGFVQVSGIRVRFAPSRKVGERVTGITVGGAPLDPARRYRVATTNNLAGGGLGYFQIWKNDAIVDTDGSVLDALAAHVKALGTVTPGVEGRLAPS
jgi:2',3'-cyclic-nucleotide 2'-phosphodiesterase (5'-nucleotidase family)